MASVNYLFENGTEIIDQIRPHAERLQQEYDGNQANGRISPCLPSDNPNNCQNSGGNTGSSSSCCFQGNFEWNWGRFGTSIIGGGAVGAGTAWVVNAIPGAGQVAYGSAIAGGAVGGGLAYIWARFDDWLWSSPNGGGGSPDCSITGLPTLATECPGE